MPIPSETVAVPVTKGLDLHLPARLIEPPGLLEAVNVQFTAQGAAKRFGHVAHKVRAGTYPAGVTQVRLTKPTLTPYGAKVVDSNWLYGWGVITSPVRTDDDAAAGTGPYPEPGYVFGGFSRDSELVAWTGHSFISHTPSQELTTQGATVPYGVIPVLNALPIAKSSTAQYHPDTADNSRVRVVVWQTKDGAGASGASVYYSAYDSVTLAPILLNQLLSTTNPFYPRIISLGNWFHIFLVERDTNKLRLYSFAEDELATVTSRNVGDSTNYYDVWKVDETKAVTLRNDGTDLNIDWIGVTGTNPSDEVATAALDLTFNVTPETPLHCSICTHPTTGRIGVGFLTSSGSTTVRHVMGGTYDRTGALIGSITDMGLYGGDVQGHRVSIAPKYLLSSGSLELFDVYASLLTNNAIPTLATKRFRFDSSAAYTTTTSHWQHLASRAFRAGDRTFVWAGNNSTLQSTWFLLDEFLKPVAHLDFSVANTPITVTSSDPTLCSVNFVGNGANKDLLVFHTALGYKQRVETTSESTGLFTEPSIQYVAFDFLPPLRAVQAGRGAYIAGGQVVSYDGAEAVESGFHVAPEFVLAQSNAGSLADTGTYSYRIDLCYRNAQNEEIRSHSLLSQIVLTGTNKTVTLTINSALTRRDNAYFLIFRNAVLSGEPTSTWNLLNSRDPTNAKYLANAQGTAQFSFVDDGTIVSDANITARELYPGNTPSYQYPFAPPACEVIATGKNRIWVSGGELLPGQVAPSRLYAPLEVPSWNGNIVIQVDRNEAPITGIGPVGDVMAIFRERSIYIQEGDGPDNVSNGDWPPPRLTLSDMGTQSQESLVSGSDGLWFQASVGFRLLGPGGQIAPAGVAVDTLGATFQVAASLAVPARSEVRWYGPTGTLVYNQLRDSWSTWTCEATGATRGSDNDLAVLFRQDGYFFLETQDFYRDNQDTFEYRIRFPWLHGGALGDFARIRRFSGHGTWDSAHPHQVSVNIYYDEREFSGEYWLWNVPDTTQNSDTWGAGTWGKGTWGDTLYDRGRDSVWRFRRRPRKQKCSVFSISIGDNASDGPGFTLSCIGLELAKKTGLDRIRTPGGSDTYRP